MSKMNPVVHFEMPAEDRNRMRKFLGLTERAAINKEYEEMLARLCKIKEVWCLSKEKGQY